MITLAQSEARPAIKKVRLSYFTATVPARYAEAIFERGYIDGSGKFVAVDSRLLRFSDTDETADYTFTQLVNAASAARDLALQLEQLAVAVNVFAGAIE